MDSTAIAASRNILTRLHEVMASRSHAQAKLNTVVEVIGECLDSEVCSIYLLREGMLELFATRGLSQEAVHVTRMGIGEGLVGTIAERNETLNLAEAAAHPDFSYRPETGEDRFHSFAGVPIVHRERVVGVLGVQHVDPRRYEEVEIETLQTVAMVLSELIANAGLIDEEDRRGPGSGQSGSELLTGLTLVKGLAIGNAVYHQPRVTIEHVVAEDTEAERQRVLLAFDKMREQIDKLAGQAEFGVAGEHVEVIETYKMFAY
ncbi:MAG: GAF domain-containing protein, partial [Novosphingobium sp.]|nr:GAF domain-containing protein [Novosphingobium sp.]